ncbi:MAG: hypothetical protein ACRELY_02680, partial [Polyangiaceae bacterium]
NDISAVSLIIDGAPLIHEIDGSALALDPGNHTFTFSSAGTNTLEKAFVLREGEKDRHEAIVLIGKKVASTSRQHAPPGSPKRSPLARGAGFGLASLGLVGIGVGAFFGLRASNAWSRSQDECGARACAPSSHDEAVHDHDDAVESATISTIAFAAGGALMAGGAVLIFVAPVVTPKSASLDVVAHF